MFLAKVKKYISDNQLIDQHAVIVVGFSGGADSVTLLDILVRLGYRCIAAHCNFHLRGDESDADAAFTKKWCEKNKITYTSADFDTVQYASDHKISIEMAARDLRYNWFETIRKQYDAEAIAVGHHQDDSVETVLLNLIRGTGISGLRGILPKNDKIVRPLLCVGRDEIENYLRSKNIPFRTDSTNEQGIYRRNFLRLHILPALQTLNPAVREALLRTAANMAEVEKVYRTAIDSDIAKVVEDRQINIEQLRKSVSPQAVLYEFLSPLGFTSSVVEDILDNLEAISGKQFFSKTHRLIKDREVFILDEIRESKQTPVVFSISEDDHRPEAPIRLEIQKLKAPIIIDKNRNCLFVDADQLSFPLTLRNWKPGDWFIPFGMKGKKKVSDFFTDQKFSLKEKEDAWLLFSDKRLVWIVGHRSDERFKVNSTTQNILKITWIEPTVE